MRKLLYLDLETGGLSPDKNPILSLSCIVEIDNKIKEVVDFKLKALNPASVEKEAKEVHGLDGSVGLEPSVAYVKFTNILDKYINKFNPQDKFYLIGYNCHCFDVKFLRAWFINNGSNYFGSYFYHPSIDVMLITAGFCIGQRNKLSDFKLPTVAKSLGIPVEEEKLHESLYDVELTRKIWKLLEEQLI